MTLSLELPPDIDAQLQAGATLNGVSKEEYALQKLRELTPQPASSQTAGEAILQLTQELFGNMPDEEQNKLPSDYAINHNFYIHGGTKVQE